MVQIEPMPPFQISPEHDVTHAVKENIQVSVTGDVGDHKVNHRVGHKPSDGSSSRWLHVHLKDHGLHVFVHGTHVVVTAKDMLPTLDLQDNHAMLNRAFAALRAEKDERGRYVVDTEHNRKVVADLLEVVTLKQRNRLTAWVRNAIARVVE